MLSRERQIQEGAPSGIIIQHHPKHGIIDPANYTHHQLVKATGPYDRGSQWVVSEQEQFDLIRQVLELHNVRLGDPAGKFQGQPQDKPVGVSNGKFVHTVEVRFNGRYVHGYPCDP